MHFKNTIIMIVASFFIIASCCVTYSIKDSIVTSADKEIKMNLETTKQIDLNHYDPEFPDLNDAYRKDYLNYIIRSDEKGAWIMYTSNLEYWSKGVREKNFKNVGFLSDILEAELYQNKVSYLMLGDKYLLEGYGEVVNIIDLENGNLTNIVNDAIDISVKNNIFKFIRRDHNAYMINHKNPKKFHLIRTDIVSFEKKDTYHTSNWGDNWTLATGKACFLDEEGVESVYNIPYENGYDIISTHRSYEGNYIDDEGCIIEDKAVKRNVIFSVYKPHDVRDVYMLSANIKTSDYDVIKLASNVRDAKADTKFDRTDLIYISDNMDICRIVIDNDKVGTEEFIMSNAIGIVKSPIQGVGIILKDDLFGSYNICGFKHLQILY